MMPNNWEDTIQIARERDDYKIWYKQNEAKLERIKKMCSPNDPILEIINERDS